MSGVIAAEEKRHLLAGLENLNGRNTPQWLKDIRSTAATQFGAMELPNHRQEEWRFTDVRPLFQIPFHVTTAPDAHGLTADDVAPFRYGATGWNELVFVDGFYAPELSSLSSTDGVRVGSLRDAIGADKSALENHLNQYVGSPNPFSVLNAAYLQDGFVVEIAAATRPEHPIHAIFISTDAPETRANCPRTLIVLGEHCEASIVESYVGLAGNAVHFTNAVAEIVVGAGAKLKHFKTIQEGSEAYHHCTTKVRLDRDANFEDFAGSFEGKVVRNALTVLFDGSGSECTLNGLSLSDGDGLVDNAINIDHAQGQCRSRIGYKNILDGRSKVVFTGKVDVRRDAQRTDSDQLNNTLLLSEDATIDTKPQLEIYADDVKCTHGATIGAAPKEVIFYFQSRGIDPDVAQGILTYGFAGEVVEPIAVAPLRDRLDSYLFNRYSPE